MKFIKIITPKGKAFTVPKEGNEGYYENLNRSIKDPKLQYKIEPVEAKPPKKVDNPLPTPGAEAKPALNKDASKTGVEKENAGTGSKGKGRPSKQ
jgi:hypothetical protein